MLFVKKKPEMSFDAMKPKKRLLVNPIKYICFI